MTYITNYRSAGLDLKVTKNEYKSTNCLLKVDPVTMEVEAWSYRWWRFVTTDTCGNVVFNNTTYSQSTNGHQREVRSVLRRLGMQVHVWLTDTRESMHSAKDGIEKEINNIKESIAEITKEMQKPRTHKRKNQERADLIKELEYRIVDLQRYLDEYIDKKPIPIQKGKKKIDLTDKWGKDRYDSYKKYFLKPNGKLQTNEYMECLRRIHWFAPESIDKIKNIFSVKDIDSLLTVVTYPHADDLNKMLPDLDTNDWVSLKRWLNKNGIENLSALNLDKIHTYLINKNTRLHQKANPNPRPAVTFPVHPALEKIKDQPGLTLLDSPQALRKEGRQQSHCIGSDHYISDCKRGYQAINYKGYTFFFGPDLTLKQTHGKHNSQTPESVKVELTKLIKQAS